MDAESESYITSTSVKLIKVWRHKLFYDNNGFMYTKLYEYIVHCRRDRH